MRVWPGLRLIGPAGRYPGGLAAAGRATQLASCQGLTLHNRVRLGLESCHLTLHLYVPHGPRASSCWRRPRTGSTALQGLQHEVALEEHAPLPGPSATRAGPPQARGPCGARTLRGAARGCRRGPRRGSALRPLRQQAVPPGVDEVPHHAPLVKA